MTTIHDEERMDLEFKTYERLKLDNKKKSSFPTFDFLPGRRQVNIKGGKCMLCEEDAAKIISWRCARGVEKGNTRSICLDCIFENCDQQIVKRLAKEDTEE